jgi:hypothetical protein
MIDTADAGRATDGSRRERLEAARHGFAAWRKGGPYPSERQRGTIREDYSTVGNAWNDFTHDQARWRTDFEYELIDAGDVAADATSTSRSNMRRRQLTTSWLELGKATGPHHDPAHPHEEHAHA